MDDDLPCPECDGWMRLEGRHWVCGTCGHRSEELAEDEPPATAPLPTAADLAVQQGVATSSPTYAPLAGRPRSFGMDLLLGVVTFGIYFGYWHWKAFREVHAQERDRGWSGLLLLALAFVAADLAWLVTRPGWRDGQPGVTDAGWPADALALAVNLTVLAFLVLETKNLDRFLVNRGQRKTGALGWLLADAAIGLVSRTLPHDAQSFVFIVGLPVALVGYYLLQNGLNLYWSLARRSRFDDPPTALTPVPS